MLTSSLYNEGTRRSGGTAPRLLYFGTRWRLSPLPVGEGTPSSVTTVADPQLVETSLTSEENPAKFFNTPSPCPDVIPEIQGDSFGTRPKKMRISQRLFIRF